MTSMRDEDRVAGTGNSGDKLLMVRKGPFKELKFDLKFEA